MRVPVQLCNILSRAVVGGFFRENYSAKTLRRNMKMISSTPIAALKWRVPATEIESFKIDGMNVEFISTNPNQKKILLFLHGGGYFMGSIEGHRRIAWELSHHCNVKVLNIDYRLAPENPFPACLEDAKKAYHFLRKNYPNASVSIGGDSAGGGLSLALVMALRDEGAVMPDQVFAASPWADLTCAGDSMLQNATKDFWLTKTGLSSWAADYYAKTSPSNPYVSPVFGDYKSFPPLLIFCGDHEILLSDSQKIYEKAKAAGVHVKLHIGSEMQHIWFLAFPFLQESHAAIDELKSFLGEN